MELAIPGTNSVIIVDFFIMNSPQQVLIDEAPIARNGRNVVSKQKHT